MKVLGQSHKLGLGGAIPPLASNFNGVETLAVKYRTFNPTNRVQVSATPPEFMRP